MNWHWNCQTKLSYELQLSWRYWGKCCGILPTSPPQIKIMMCIAVFGASLVCTTSRQYTLTSTISQNIHIVTTPCRKVPKFHSDSPIHACINYRLYSLSLHCHMNKHFTVTTGCRCCPHLSLQIRVSPFRQEELNYILLAIRACNPQECLTTLQWVHQHCRKSTSKLIK